MTAEAPNAMQQAGDERIHVLDVLRGIALLGMYVVHVQGYRTKAEGEATGVATVLEHTIGWFFDGRFYTMFGILFGVGFAVQLARADARGEGFVVRYLRRAAMLAVFGFIAEGILGYNVLFGYAVWGIPLLLVRRWPVRWLVVLLVLCAAWRPLYNTARISWYAREPGGIAAFMAEVTESNRRFQAAVEAHNASERSTEWSTVVRGRLEYMPKFQRQWNLWPTGAFTLFLIGLIGWRLRLFQDVRRRQGMIVGLMVFGVASWVIATWVLPIGGRPPAVPREGIAPLERLLTAARANGLLLLRDQWLAFAYMGAILLLVDRRPVWLDRLAPFAWAGRMALTNYMVQVLLLNILFERYGLGWTVSPGLVPVAALILFAGQAVFSRWWLATHAWGPLEWIWRSVTYWTWQPFRSARAPGQVPSTA